MFKKVILVLCSVVLIFTIINLIRQTTSSLQAGSRLDKAADELSDLQVKNRQLKEQLTYVQTIEFIEEQSRDKLNLAKPNETIIVIPPQDIDKTLQEQNPPPEIKLAHWQGWLRLFFN